MREIINVGEETLYFADSDDNGKVKKVERYKGSYGSGVGYMGVQTVEVCDFGGVTVLEETIRPTTSGERSLKEIEDKYPGAVIVGSENQARAYPERVSVPRIKMILQVEWDETVDFPILDDSTFDIF